MKSILYTGDDYMNNFSPTDFDRYLFHNGKHYQSYNILGAHLCQKDGKKGARFTVWAPNARQIYITGDFNNWSASKHSLRRIKDSGLWTIFIPDIKQGDKYKYKIRGYKNNIREKADPYAFYAEKPPATASRVYSLSKYQWHDQKWLAKRENYNPYQSPVLIYEMHLAS